MKNTIEALVKDALTSLSIEVGEVLVEHPGDLSQGDYSTNVALAHAKVAGMNPKELAEKIVTFLEQSKNSFIERIEVAGPGFINFYLTEDFFKKSIEEINERGGEFGKGNSLEGQKIIVEHTDPNPFKEFHIGHLMPNVIGSTIARLFEANGAEVKQACYQGDVGMHVAKTIRGIQISGNEVPMNIPLNEKAAMLGAYYVAGSLSFDSNPEHAAQIKELNKIIYERSNSEVNDLYYWGKKVSLEYFESIYKKLGVRFDYYFFESVTAPIGKKIVEEHTGEIFKESEGAIVFHAEEYDPSLHTRVFINSEGLPTYEAKELGLAKIKYETYPYTKSVVVTGNEIKDYFRVLLQAMKLVFPDLREKTKHLPHGMLRLTSGKMSSRTGDVITAESLIEEVKEKVKGDEDVAIGAIKYMILRQAIGNDIIFDVEKSVSTEGDSGVYLQYAYARTNSLLEKAKEANTHGEVSVREIHPLEKLLYRFPEVVERSMLEYSPNLLVTYLTEIVASFSNLYAKEEILSNPYLVSLTRSFNTVLKNGLVILGIPTPERM